jgi:tRNA A37 methylthiotransferase MiaB
MVVESKTFYLETFGCQMNAHDSEKVVGTLMVERAMRRWRRPKRPHLVLYNTCSIRDKAEQKVFHRLQQFKRNGKDKVSACSAAWRSRKANAFSIARRMSAWCAARPATTSWANAGADRSRENRRVTGLSLDTEEAFDTPFTRRDNPHRAYITIIEGCDKSCAYCVVPFTRGPERSRTSESVMAEARRLADEGYSEIQLLGQNVNSYRDPTPAAGTSPLCSGAWPRFRESAACATPRLTRAISAATSWMPWIRTRHLRPRASAGAIGIVERAGQNGPALHARRIHAAHRLAQERPPRLFHHHRHHRRLPRRDGRGFRGHARCSTKSNTIRCSASSIRRGRTRPPSVWKTRYPTKRSSGAW